MSISFKVLARDGSEYGPAKPETLHQWYADGRIARDSLTSEKGTLNWRRLDAVFDVSTWDAPAPGERSAIPNLVSKPPNATVWDDDRRTSGMFAAAILLFVNAIFSVAIVAVVLLTPMAGLQGKEMVSPTFLWMSVPIMDAIVGVGLLRGKWQFRRFAMIRATLGVFAVLTRALVLQSPGGWIELVFQIVFAAGMLGLLFGGPPSRERVFAGVTAVVVAWFGSTGGAFLDGYLGYLPDEPPPRVRSEPWAEGSLYTGGMLIEDDEAGFKLKLPADWYLQHEREGETSLPGTNLIARNSTAGCSARLQIDVSSTGVSSLDDYLSKLVKSRKMSVPTLTAGTRSDVMIGDRIGRRLETSWTEGLTPFRGFSTVCRDGTGYFLLTGWCEESVYEFAFPAFQALEARFEFTSVKADPTGGDRNSRQRPPRARNR